MFVIKNGFIDSENKKYSNIRNIHFKEFRDVAGNLGTFVTETIYQGFDVDTSFKLSNGVYLFKSSYDPKVALRVYKDLADYKYVFHNDAKLVSKLQERQDKVKLTEFPTGVVTIDNKTIGQEIPYYENYVTIYEMFMKKSYSKIPTHYYIEVLNILKELYKADIAYSDIHAKNFLASLADETIKLIDFEEGYVKFDDDKRHIYTTLINNLKQFIIKLNRLSDIKFDESFNKTETIEEVEESILENQEKLLRKA